MADKEKIILPEKYYLDNFCYVLDFVENKYAPLLSEAELNFMVQFRQLTGDAQCLYVRISNRKGQFFKLKKLNYTEIADRKKAHEELLKSGFATGEKELSVEELYQLVSIYNKPEIVKVIEKMSDHAVDNKLPKAEFVLSALEIIDNSLLLSKFYDPATVITQGRVEILAMIKLFFFGHNHGDMSDFVIRDIGHAKFIEIDESKLGQSFDSRAEAEAVMDISLLNKEFYALDENFSSLEILNWFGQINVTRFLKIEKASVRAEKLIYKVGYKLEREGHRSEALKVYQLTKASPMRERMIRIYTKQKAFDQAHVIANEILENPNDNREYYIAQDVINKLDKKLKSTTIRQKKGLEITVSKAYLHQVEQGALAYFMDKGYRGCHSENSIWRTLFGLIFWEEIFDPQYKSLHQPLQRNPADMRSKDFYQKRKSALRGKLESLRTKKQIAYKMKTTYSMHEGVSNPYVYWDAEIKKATWKLVEFLKPGQVRVVLAEMMIDPKNRTTGFPDLFVWNETRYHLYEVKSPTDHLSEQQLFWLEKFKEWKIPSEIALVKWILIE